jgi:hypothetical protein
MNKTVKVIILISIFVLIQCRVDVPTIEMSLKLAWEIYDGGDNDFVFSDPDIEIEKCRAASTTELMVKFCLLKHKADYYITIRGSEILLDWVRNGKISTEENAEVGAYFHSGFLTEIETIYPILRPYLETLSGKVVFTGHSAGGGMAQALHVLARRRLRGFRDSLSKTAGDNFESVVFAAAPSISLSGDVKDCASHITAFIHNRDPIPILFVKSIGGMINGMCSWYLGDSFFCEEKINGFFGPIVDLANGVCVKRVCSVCGVCVCRTCMHCMHANVAYIFHVIIAYLDYGNINAIVGDYIYWLQYECNPLRCSPDCSVGRSLDSLRKTSTEVTADDPMRWSEDFFQDHRLGGYRDYLTQLFHPNSSSDSPSATTGSGGGGSSSSSGSSSVLPALKFNGKFVPVYEPVALKTGSKLGLVSVSTPASPPASASASASGLETVRAEADCEGPDWRPQWRAPERVRWCQGF